MEAIRLEYRPRLRVCSWNTFSGKRHHRAGPRIEAKIALRLLHEYLFDNRGVSWNSLLSTESTTFFLPSDSAATYTIFNDE